MQQISVSTLVKYIKNKLDSDNNIQRVLVSGELSNFHAHYSGHLYFTLKDENAAINCVMFKSSAQSLLFTPKDGDSVIIEGNVSLFETSGQMQLYALKMNLDGLGDLYLKYEQLKNKLESEGIFLDEHKKSLKKEYIDTVAVLVGDKSAAMSDIKTTFKRRWPFAKVDYYPVLVQGSNAPSDIIDKLIKVDDMGYDAILLCRGGGSFEDLFCFNDENLIRTIYNLKTFIVSGIGHEKDFTLCDFVCDERAATPTASVEIITPNINDVINEINENEKSIRISLNKILDNKRLLLDYNYSKLISFSNKFVKVNSDIDHYLDNIKLLIKTKINNTKLDIKRYSTLLDAYSIDNTLKRGYTLVFQNNKIIKKKKELHNDEFELRFIDGTIKAKGV